MEKEEKIPELTDKLVLIYLSCFSGLIWIAAVGIFIYMLTDYSAQCYTGICGLFIFIKILYVIYAPSMLILLWTRFKEGGLFSPNNEMRTLFFVSLVYIPFLYFWSAIVWLCVEKIPFD